MRIPSSPRNVLIWVAYYLLGATVLAKCNDVRSAVASIPQGEEPVSLVQWRVSGTHSPLTCVISERPATSQLGLPVRTFTVYRDDKGALTKIFASESVDGVVNLYPLGEYNARLILTSVGGSAYHFRVFAYVEGHVRNVLEIGSKLPVEVLYDGRGEESILVTDPVLERGIWTPVHSITTVFKWTGERYQKIGVVPWEKRTQCLTPQSCASLD